MDVVTDNMQRCIRSPPILQAFIVLTIYNKKDSNANNALSTNYSNPKA